MTSPPPLDATWVSPPTLDARLQKGRGIRARVPRSALSSRSTGARDPIGILDAQNATRVPELLRIRAERMSASPFAFYRGTAAIMAADLARDPHSGIRVASCGDAHVANFGFYASPQRTLVFDLNDFDEAAWAPWDWDVKRLVTSIVIAGQATARDERVVRDAALSAVRTYARLMSAGVRKSPLERYYEHFDVSAQLTGGDAASRRTIRAATRDARKRTGERATRRITERGENGRLRFVDAPPTMTHTEPELEERLQELTAQYRASANVDIRMLLQHYVISDLARRVVGVGSVGTRCFLVLMQDGAGNPLLLQAKQAGRSVLEEFGGIAQPEEVIEYVARFGQGARVVALQRILQAVSDPFLGHVQVQENGNDYAVRQFHDMKGGIDMETLEDAPFRRYADTCAATLARAHVQSDTATLVAGYIGNGRVVSESILEWAYAYADVSRADYQTYLVARGLSAPPVPA